MLSCNRDSKIPSSAAELEYKEKNIVLEGQLDSLEMIHLDLKDQITTLKSIVMDSVQPLKYKPESIKNSFRSQKQLLSKKAVLGGNMHIVWIKILGNNWLIAQYEDGHVQGVSIYSYQGVNDSTFTFKLLDTAENF